MRAARLDNTPMLRLYWQTTPGFLPVPCIHLLVLRQVWICEQA
jgi:hypothetical protein